VYFYETLPRRLRHEGDCPPRMLRYRPSGLFAQSLPRFSPMEFYQLCAPRVFEGPGACPVRGIGRVIRKPMWFRHSWVYTIQSTPLVQVPLSSIFSFFRWPLICGQAPFKNEVLDCPFLWAIDIPFSRILDLPFFFIGDTLVSLG